MKISRNELYDLVWTSKLKGAAEKLRIKSTDLSKICKNNDIPTPTSHYWIQLALGRPVSKPLLPNPENNYSIEINDSSKETKLKKDGKAKSFNSGRYTEELDKILEKEEAECLKNRTPLIRLAEQGKLKIDFQSDPKEWKDKILKATRAFPVSETLNSKRKIILDTRTYLSLQHLPWDEQQKHPLNRKVHQRLDIEVEKENEIRALKIFDSLISILEALGGTMVYENRQYNWEKKTNQVSFENTRVALRIVERLKRIKNTNPQYSYEGEYKFVRSGKLKIKIDDEYVIEDTEYEKLEAKIDKVITKIIESVKYKRKQEEEKRLAQLEAIRQAELQRQEEERKREIQSLKSKEKEEIIKQLALVKRLNIWKNIKENIMLLQNEILNHPESIKQINNLLDTLHKLEKLFNPCIIRSDDYILEENDIEELAVEFFQNKDISKPLTRPTFYSSY
ncbi:MAG: hypothetical protein J1F16_10270 [Muribaculaceae bacterium]|nr:hypothetical protein [Muribaculaceae bacterium]